MQQESILRPVYHSRCYHRARDDSCELKSFKQGSCEKHPSTTNLKKKKEEYSVLRIHG